MGSSSTCSCGAANSQLFATKYKLGTAKSVSPKLLDGDENWELWSEVWLTLVTNENNKRCSAQLLLFDLVGAVNSQLRGTFA